MIGMEPKLRNQLILRVLYATALRISEFCQLRWDSLIRRENGGQVTVLAKGGKTHTVLILEPLWSDLMRLRCSAVSDGAPVFPGRNGRPLSTTQVWRIVKRAAERAGISKVVSPHVLRACHATHAIEHNCPIHIVQSTLNHSNVSVTSRYLRPKESDSSVKYLTI
jgi:site-specific recombinase XerD